MLRTYFPQAKESDVTTTLTATRTLHLVDIENLVGDPKAPTVVVLDVLDRYLDVAGHRDGDHVVIAANPGLMAKVAFDLPVPCNVHAARGENGADLVLLAQAEPSRVAARYDRLVIGSGDGAFADVAIAVRDLDTPVVVVAQPGCMSNRLLGAALGIRALGATVTLAA